MKAGDLVRYTVVEWTGVLQAVYANESDPSDQIGKVVFVKHGIGAFEYIPLSALEPATVDEVEQEKAARRAVLERAMQRVG